MNSLDVLDMDWTGITGLQIVAKTASSITSFWTHLCKITLQSSKKVDQTSFPGNFIDVLDVTTFKTYFHKGFLECALPWG